MLRITSVIEGYRPRGIGALLALFLELLIQPVPVDEVLDELEPLGAQHLLPREALQSGQRGDLRRSCVF